MNSGKLRFRVNRRRKKGWESKPPSSFFLKEGRQAGRQTGRQAGVVIWKIEKRSEKRWNIWIDVRVEKKRVSAGKESSRMFPTREDIFEWE